MNVQSLVPVGIGVLITGVIASNWTFEQAVLSLAEGRRAACSGIRRSRQQQAVGVILASAFGGLMLSFGFSSWTTNIVGALAMAWTLLAWGYHVRLSSAYRQYSPSVVSRIRRSSLVLCLCTTVGLFPVLFLGATPEKTPAMYSLMNYADLVLGTWYPMGGMHEIIKGMVSVAEESGVELGSLPGYP